MPLQSCTPWEIHYENHPKSYGWEIFHSVSYNNLISYIVVQKINHILTSFQSLLSPPLQFLSIICFIKQVKFFFPISFSCPSLVKPPTLHLLHPRCYCYPFPCVFSSIRSKQDPDLTVSLSFPPVRLRLRVLLPKRTLI